MATHPYPDPKADALFHETIGRSVAAWAKVDDELFQIFHASVGGQHKQCAIIYYRLTGMDLRMKLTRELVHSVLPPAKRDDGKKAWKQATAGFAELLRVRAQIAHQPVAARVKWGALDINPPLGGLPFSGHHSQHWYEIAAGQHEKARGRDYVVLRIEDLHAHIAEVNRFASALAGFRKNVLSEPLPALPQQDPQPPHKSE